MAFSYKKLWVLMAEKEVSRLQLIEQANICAATFTKMRAGKPVALDVLAKICECLNADIGDVVSYIPEAKE